MTSRGGDPDAPDCSYPASERLQTKSEYQRIFDEGTAVHGSVLVIFLLLRDGLERRVGIVAGRKVGNAVRRNRAKRLLREAYRHTRAELPGTGVQMVLVARRGAGESGFDPVLRELHRLLARGGVIRDGDRARP